MNREYEAIVVGAGISGLYAAYRLREEFSAENVRLFEASEYVGGHIRSDSVNGYICDWGPNGFLDNQPLLLDWIEEMGLSDELVRANEAAAHRFLLLGGKLVEIVPPLKFLVSPILSWRGRLKLLQEPFAPQKKVFEAESVWDFAKRRIGEEAADTLVSAMVLGIFGGDAKKLSLDHAFPRMAAMEQEYGGLFRAMMAKKRAGGGLFPAMIAKKRAGGGLFPAMIAKKRAGGGVSPMGPGGTLTTLRGGIGQLVQRAAECVSDVTEAKTAIDRVSREGDRFVLHLKNGTECRTARLYLAVPAYVAAQLLREGDAGAGKALDRIDYASLVVVCTGHRREDVEHDLNGFGFLVPPKENRSTLGCIWTSSAFDGFAPDGKVLLRTMLGGATNPEVIGWSDDEVFNAIRKDVYTPLGVRGEPDLVQVFRHRRGIPQYGLDHGAILKELDAFEAQNAGFHFIGNAYRGISMNDCVATTHKATVGASEDSAPAKAAS